MDMRSDEMKIQINDLVREATADEIAFIEKVEADALAKIDAEEQAEANKVTVAAKLAALGLTADDLKALGL
jgi:hypothetical protein